MAFVKCRDPILSSPLFISPVFMLPITIFNICEKKLSGPKVICLVKTADVFLKETTFSSKYHAFLQVNDMCMVLVLLCST